METIRQADPTEIPPLPIAKRKAEDIVDSNKDSLDCMKIRTYDKFTLIKILLCGKNPTTEEVENLKQRLSKNDFFNPFVLSITKSFSIIKKTVSIERISLLIDSLRSFLRFSNTAGAKELRVEMKLALTYLSNAGIIYKSENPKKITQVNFKNEALGIKEGDGTFSCASNVLSALVAFHKNIPYDLEKILTEGILRYRKLNHPKDNPKSSIAQIFGPTNPDIQRLDSFIYELPAASNYPWLKRFYYVLEEIKAPSEGLLSYQHHGIMCRVLSDKRVELFDSHRSFAFFNENNILKEDVDHSVFPEGSGSAKYQVKAEDGAYHVICKNVFAAALFLTVHTGVNYISSVNTCIRFIPVKVILPTMDISNPS